MKTRWFWMAAVTMLAPAMARATDAPHNGSVIANSAGCQDCHMMHFASGPTLTNQPDIFTVCTHCHNNLSAEFTFGGKWYSSDQATPNAGGHSHRWSGSTTSDAHGATPPTDPALKPFARNGLECSSCHDPHAAPAANSPGQLHVSVATGSPLPHSGGTASNATRLTLTVAPGAVAKGYRIRIGPATNQFQVSHDALLADAASVTWSAVPYDIPGPNAAIALTQPGDDPAVNVSFSDIPAIAGDWWDFYVGFPFMRMAIGEGELCLACHAERAQGHADVEGSAAYGWGTGRTFSHPVGEGLNANQMNYDVATPLDVNGAAQGSAGADAIPANDLRLSATNRVTCLSCHAAHGASTNSQTP